MGYLRCGNVRGGNAGLTPMRRVLLVTHGLHVGGGAATMTAFLYRVLSQSGEFSADIISLSGSSRDESSVRLRSPKTWFRGVQVIEQEWRGLPYRHVGANFSELEFQRYKPRRQLSLLFREYDLVQFVVGTPPWACVAADVGQPYFLWTATTHWADRASRVLASGPLRRQWGRAMVGISRPFETRALEHAEFVFALSPYALKSVQERSKGLNASVVACGVDTGRFHPALRPRGGYIISAGRFSDSRKNVNLMIKAYKNLVDHCPGAPDLYLAGEPPVASGIELIKSLGLSSRIKLLGLKTEDELADLYRNADFFVLSSDEEGLGIVLLEAMASGLPVVSTRSGGPESIITDGETGFLTPLGDVEDLSKTMKLLTLNPELRTQVGLKARNLVGEKYSFQGCGEAFLEKYREALGMSSPHAYAASVG